MVQSARLSVLVGIITMGVTAMRTDINSIGRDQLMQAAAKANLAACQQRQFAESLSLQARNNIIQHVRAFIPAAATPTTAG